jgi:hypothetical protein
MIGWRRRRNLAWLAIRHRYRPLVGANQEARNRTLAREADGRGRAESTIAGPPDIRGLLAGRRDESLIGGAYFDIAQTMRRKVIEHFLQRMRAYLPNGSQRTASGESNSHRLPLGDSTGRLSDASVYPQPGYHQYGRHRRGRNQQAPTQVYGRWFQGPADPFLGEGEYVSIETTVEQGPCLAKTVVTMRPSAFGEKLQNADSAWILCESGTRLKLQSSR